MEAPAEHDFVLQQEIPVVEQMDAQLAERSPALQAPLARKKCALNAHFISRAHRNVPCNGMSTNCLRYLMCNLNSLQQLICHNPCKAFYLTLPISPQPRLYKCLLHDADETLNHGCTALVLLSYYSTSYPASPSTCKAFS